MALAPGATRQVSATVAVSGKDGAGTSLTPGDYEVSFTYYAKSRKLLAGATGDLVSSVVKFSVKD